MAKDKAPVERKFVKANNQGVEVKAGGTVGSPKAGNATGLRVAAVILWLAAIGFEILTILILNRTLYIPGNFTMWLIIGIAADLVCVVIGSLLWKKANRIDPVSKQNKLKFLIWNQMGVIVSVIAFLPLIIFLVKDKNLDAKTKKIVTLIAGVALVAAVGLSIDFDPPSQEDMAQAQETAAAVGDGTIYWTQWGKSYHLDPDCSTLLRSATVFTGTMQEAFDANRTDPCDFCALQKAVGE